MAETKHSETIKVTYKPSPGDPDHTEVFGVEARAGEAVEIPAKFADKARGNPTLSVAGEKTYGDEKPKAANPEAQEEASFEDNVVRERSREYLEGRTHFANSPPGEAERLARAQEAAAELKAAADSDDADKPRRGRQKAK